MDKDFENAPDEERLSIPEIEKIVKDLQEQQPDANRDTELLCGITLLVEDFSKNERAREVRHLAELAFRLTENNPAIDSTALEALPRLISALEATPFNHVMRELLANLIIIAFRNGKDMMRFKQDAKKLISLDILLEPDVFQHRNNHHLKEILSRLFSSEELLDIIANPKIGFLRRDPVEYTWKWENIYYDVEDELDEIFKDTDRHMGFCFGFWSKKRDLLKEKYGIEWSSPSQMNPGVMFD